MKDGRAQEEKETRVKRKILWRRGEGKDQKMGR